MKTRRRFLAELSGVLALPALGTARRAGARPDATGTASAVPSAAPLAERSWLDVAAEFDIDPEQHFFNTGTLGSCPRVVRQRVIAEMEALDARPTFHYWAKLMPQYFDVREKAARLLGVADPVNVTLTHSTTEGINIIARGLGLEAGDEVVMTDHEHVGGFAPWAHLAARRGVVIRQYEMTMTPPPDDEIVAGLERLITPKTRVLMVSHICYTNGLVMPVETLGRLARERGIHFLIDGAHPVGQMPLSIESTGCAFYAASGHKWLCAPRGTGLLYVRPDLLGALEPLLAAYDPRHVPKDVGSFDEGATRLNFVWTNNLHDIIGLGRAIDFHLDLGPERVRRRCLDLTERFRAGAASIPDLEMITVGGEARTAPMTTLKVSGADNKEVFRTLSGMGYKVKEVLDEELAQPINAIRVCTHVFNTEAQVDGLLEALDTVMRS